MEIEEFSKKTVEYLNLLLKACSLALRPKRLVGECADAFRKAGLLPSITAIFCLAFLYSAVFAFGDGYKFEKVPVIAFGLLLQGVLFYPTILASISTSPKVIKRNSTAFVLAIYMATIIEMPLVASYLVFILSENYIFFFLSYLSILFTFVYLIFVIPIAINKGLFKFLSPVLALICFALSSVGLRYIETSTFLKNDDPIVLDQIFQEFADNEILTSSHAQFLIGNSTQVVDKLQETMTKRSPFIEGSILQNIENIASIQDSLEKVRAKLRFRMNREFIDKSLEIVRIFRSLEVDYKKYKKNLDDLLAESKIGIGADDGEALVKALSLAGGDVKTKSILVELMNTHLTEIVGYEDGLNKAIVDFNAIMKKRSEWITFKTQWIFLR